MAIGVPRLGAAASKSSGTVLAVPYPIGANAPVAGDYMVIIHGQATSVTLSAVPAGWNDLYSKLIGDTTFPVMRIYSKWAVGGETGSVSCTTPNSAGQGRMVVLSGVDQATPLDVAVQGFDSASNTAHLIVPSFDVVTAGTLLLGTAMHYSSIGTWTPPVNPAQWTEVHDVATTNPKTEIAYLAGVAAGATGAIDFWGSSSVKGLAAVLPLRPAGAATVARAKRWDGSAWVDAGVKRWNGSVYVPANIARWNGSAWV